MIKAKGQVQSGRLGKSDGRHNAKWLGVILGVHVVLALVYWHYTPFGAPPDEGPHGKYVAVLAGTGSLPVFDASNRGDYEYHQPPLYYLMGTPFYCVGRAIRMADPAAMVRLLSLILGGLSILAAYAVVRSAFPDERILPLTCAGFVGLLPTHVMLSSSVSNDVLAEVVFGLALLVMVRMLVTGLSWRRTIGLGAILGAGLLAKTTCVLLFPIVVLAYVLVWQRGASTGRSLAAHVAAVLGVGIAIGGWWLARNQFLYGDPLAVSQFQEVFQDTPTPEFWLSRGWSWGMYFALVIGWTFASFWGVFGHMNVFMPTWAYWGLAAITLGAAAGSLRAAAQMRARSALNRDVLFVCGVTLALVLLAFLKFNVSFFQAQGRYLYPALVPISVFWAIGLGQLLPQSKRHLAPYLAVGVPFVGQIIALVTCIVPKMPYYL